MLITSTVEICIQQLGRVEERHSIWPVTVHKTFWLGTFLSASVLASTTDFQLSVFTFTQQT